MKRLPANVRGTRFAATARSGVAGLAAVLLLATCGVAYASSVGRDSGQAPRHVGAAAHTGRTHPRRIVVRVAHGPVTAANSYHIDAPPAGPSVGDVRTYYLPLTRLRGRRTIGYLTGTLTTTATGKPSPGMELRVADLVFVIGRAANQLVVGGDAAYAQAAPTFATKSVVTRPVIGGAGRYAGARGWCVSTHLANNTWRHVFHLVLDR